MGDAYALALRGIGVSHSAVLQFVARLEALGPLDSVDLVQTRRSLTAAATPGADAASAETWFELHCELLEQRDARPLTNAPSLPGVQPPRATAGVEDRP
jgi:hypothetical protein